MGRRSLLLTQGFNLIPLPADTLTPGTISGMVAWYKANSLYYQVANGHKVVTWADSSGLGNDITNAITAQQPTMYTNVLNGMPVVRFGGSHALQAASKIFDVTKMYTVYIVSKATGIQDGSLIATISFVDGEVIRYMNDGGISKLRFLSGYPVGVTLDSPIPANVFTYNTTVMGDTSSVAGTVTQRVNSGVVGSGSGVRSSTQEDNFTVGALNSGAVPLTGDIAEIIVYEGAHNQADLAVVEYYLNTKYGFGFVPQIQPGLAALYESSAGITLSTLDVTDWADQSVNGNNLAQTNGAIRPSYLSPDTELKSPEASVDFTAIGQFMEAPDAASLGFGTGDFFVATYAKVDYSGVGMLFGKDDYNIGGVTGWFVQTGAGAYLRFGTRDYGGSGNFTYSDMTPVPSAGWHSLIFARVSGVLHQYVDGVLSFSTPEMGVTNINNAVPLKVNASDPFGSTGATENVAEIFMAQATMSNSLAARVHAYLAGRYVP
jgi:hypothetical protein